jgi:hypothetical protein
MPKTADDVTQSLRAWIEGVAAGHALTLLTAADEPAGSSGVTLRLIGATPIAVPRTDQSVRVLRLDYLVGVSAKDPLIEHRLLGELLFAAMTGTEFEPMPPKEAAEAAERVGLSLAGGIVLSAKLRREPARPRVPLVTQPLVVDAQTTAALEGLVVGPGNRPIVDAIVEIPALNLSELTDRNGHFRFAATPSGEAPIRLVARKHGHRVQVEAIPGRDLTIHIPLEG